MTIDRLPEDRLFVAWCHHGLLLASILRHQGKSVRLRAGFARYYEEHVAVRFSHVVCEVWNNVFRFNHIWLRELLKRRRSGFAEGDLISEENYGIYVNQASYMIYTMY